jgi:hypothetical protein
METTVIALAVVGFIVLIGLLVIYSIKKEKQRTKDLQERAGSLNLAFFPNDDLELLASLHEMHLFSQGRGRQLKNVIQAGTDDVDIYIFDYQYTTGGGKSSSTWQQTVMLFRSPSLQLPAFTLRPENVFHKIGSAFGAQDIDFDAFPDFSDHYLLKGPDEAAVRSVFGEQVLYTFEQNHGYCVESQAGDLIVYRTNKRVPPDQIQAFMEEGVRIYGLFK